MIYIGDSEISYIYIGDNLCSAIYAGETQIYPIGYFINYTSTDNQVINVPVSGWGTNVTVVNNTYTNGKGKIELSAQPTAIPSNAFYNSNLASIRINSSITTIGGSAFGACTGLTEIDIKNVSTMGDAAFVYCGNLTAITMENISSIPYQCFYGCGFTEFTVGDNVTSIGQSAFESCTALTTLTIGAGVTVIESSSFANCESLNLILAYPDTAPTIYADTFYGVAIGGVLKNNGGYEDWLSTDEAYLGYYEWTEDALVTLKWVDIRTVDNTTPLYDIAWKTNGSFSGDKWFSEKSGLTTDGSGWTSGRDVSYGRYTYHRFNSSQYTCNFLPEYDTLNDGYGAQLGYGIAQRDAARSTLTTETIDGNTYYVLGLENWQNWSPLYVPFSTSRIQSNWSAGLIMVKIYA